MICIVKAQNLLVCSNCEIYSFTICHFRPLLHICVLDDYLLGNRLCHFSANLCLVTTVPQFVRRGRQYFEHVPNVVETVLDCIPVREG